MRLRACLAVVAVAVVGCDQLSIADIKPPAGNEELEQTYDAPPGQLTVATVGETAQRFLANFDLADATDQFGVLDGLTDEANTEQEALGKDDHFADPTESAKLLGLVRIHYICRGPDEGGAVDEARNGSVSLTGKASGKGIFPILWGDFKHCIEHKGPLAYTVDGSYAILLRRAKSGGVDRLVSFRGTIETEKLTFDGRFDFRRHADGEIEFRVPGEDGDVVVGTKDGRTQLVRDRDGDWACELQDAYCQNEDTGDVVTPGDVKR